MSLSAYRLMDLRLGTAWALPIGDLSSSHIVVDLPDEPRTLQLALNEVLLPAAWHCAHTGERPTHMRLVLTEVRSITHPPTLSQWTAVV